MYGLFVICTYITYFFNYTTYKINKIRLRHSILLNTIVDLFRMSKCNFYPNGVVDWGGGLVRKFKKFCNGYPSPHVIPHLKGLKETKQMVRF